MIDNIISGYLAVFSIHFLVYIHYHFDILPIPTEPRILWMRVTNLLETAFLVVTHIFSYSPNSSYVLGIYYTLNLLLLMLQFIHSDGGVGRKILDFLWIGNYVLLLLMDVFKIGLPEIAAFLCSSENIQASEFLFPGTRYEKLILGVIIPVLRIVILEAMHHHAKRDQTASEGNCL